MRKENVCFIRKELVLASKKARWFCHAGAEKVKGYY